MACILGLMLGIAQSSLSLPVTVFINRAGPLSSKRTTYRSSKLTVRYRVSSSIPLPPVFFPWLVSPCLVARMGTNSDLRILDGPST